MRSRGMYVSTTPPPLIKDLPYSRVLGKPHFNLSPNPTVTFTESICPRTICVSGAYVDIVRYVSIGNTRSGTREMCSNNNLEIAFVLLTIDVPDSQDLRGSGNARPLAIDVGKPGKW